MPSNLFAFIYPMNLSREIIADPEYSVSVMVIPTEDQILTTPRENLEHQAWQIALSAIRTLDPENKLPCASHKGGPELLPFDSSYDDYVPDFEHNGWRAFLDWEYPSNLKKRNAE